MRNLKIILMVLIGLFLLSSCYTQLALVKQKSYDNEDYYYPPSDTLYADESPMIIQNFYDFDPYFGMHFGFYDDWWLWSSWYSPYRYYWAGFYPIRPFNPVLWYPGFIVYDPFYWDYYYNPWWWDSGPVYRTPYGPRPFTKNGSLLRGGGSKRIRVSQTTGNQHDIGGTAFLPTRTAGSVISGSVSKRSVRKTIGNENTRSIKERRSNKTIIRNKVSEHRRARRDKAMTAREKRNKRKYYPITTIRSSKMKPSSKTKEVKAQPYVQSPQRTEHKSHSRTRSTFGTTRTGSWERSTFSTPVRNNNRSVGHLRSNSSTTTRSSRSATRSRSSRSSHRK